jgi:hypothetical protein
MAEQFADFVQRSALPKQVCGQRVSKKMGAFAYRIDASTDQRPPDNRGNCNRVCKTTNGSPMSKENTAADAARTTGAQVDSDSFTDVGRQRHLRPPPTLAPNGQLAVIPIDVVQAQPNNLAGA